MLYNMTRNTGAAVTALLALSMIIGVSCQRKPAKVKRPNIVFIISDDHAFQAIGAYGGTLMPTPNIAPPSNAPSQNKVGGRTIALERSSRPLSTSDRSRPTAL